MAPPLSNNPQEVFDESGITPEDQILSAEEIEFYEIHSKQINGYLAHIFLTDAHGFSLAQFSIYCFHLGRAFQLLQDEGE